MNKYFIFIIICNCFFVNLKASLNNKELIVKNEIIKNYSKKYCTLKKENQDNLSRVDILLKNPPLNLKELTQKVLKRNPDLKATKRRIEASALVIPRVKSLDDPQFNVMRHDSPLKSNSSFSSKVRYEASQVLPFPGKLKFKGEIARQVLEFMKTEEITTMRELVLQTKRLYYNLYINYEALRNL